ERDAPAHPLAAVQRVPEDVVAAVSDVQAAPRRIRKHVEHVELLAGHGGIHVGDLVLLPPPLPLPVDLFRVELLCQGPAQYTRLSRFCIEPIYLSTRTWRVVPPAWIDR